MAGTSKEKLEALFVIGPPAERGVYGGQITTVEPDKQAAGLLTRIRVRHGKRKLRFNTARGDSLYMVTNTANLHNWLQLQRGLVQEAMRQSKFFTPR